MAMQVARLPLLSKAAATTAREEFQSNYRKMAEYLLVVLVPLSLLLTVYAGSVIHAAYGSAYGRASVALQVLVWSGLFTTSGIFYSTALIAEGRQGVAACIAGIMALVNVVLNLWLIPDFQIVGAAVSSVVAYGLGPVLLLCYRQTRLYVQLFARALLLPGLSVVPMAILCLLLRKHVVFGLIFGVMAYCSTLALLVHQKYRSGRNQEIAKISILPAKYIGRLL
jgi:O-antigen/teichoic acid export membrane protein